MTDRDWVATTQISQVPSISPSTGWRAETTTDQGRL